MSYLKKTAIITLYRPGLGVDHPFRSLTSIRLADGREINIPSPPMYSYIVISANPQCQ